MEMQNFNKAKILIVEDEPEINRLIELILQSAGYYKILKATDGLEALEIIKTQKPNLVLLDVMIPSLDGFEVCKAIKNDKNFSKIQIIMLTAKKMEEDILQGFENGAIDYISKPFSNKILLARIKAHLNNVNFEDKLTYKNLILDNKTKQLNLNNQTIDLTKFEYLIIKKFMQNTGIVFSRSKLLEHLRGDDGFDISQRAIDVQIVNLRKKLNEYGQYIETVRGLGYKLKELN